MVGGGEVNGRADKAARREPSGPFPPGQRLYVRHGFEATEFVMALHNQSQGGLAVRRAPTEVRVARGNGFTAGSAASTTISGDRAGGGEDAARLIVPAGPPGWPSTKARGEFKHGD
jgi:hypothetical protein